ncbi:MAG: hypothetical protein ACI8S6_002748, partial [Myxococcota bacterium]
TGLRAEMQASNMEDHELGDYWIVQRSLGKSCPSSTGSWSVEPLFTPDSRNYLPPILARYCVVSHASDPEQSPSGTIGNVSRDVLAVAGMAVPSDTQILTSTREQLQPFPNYTASPASLTWLTIIDTSPDGLPADELTGADDHGLKISSLARMAICDTDDECVATLMSRLALGYSVGSNGIARDVGGGSIGSIGDLATAIERQVLAWQEADTDSRLVLNLSLGWSPEYGGKIGTITPPIAAVYDALRYASCQGALVIASAGNRDTPIADDGPSYPAAWETLPAPDADACGDLIGSWWVDEDPIGAESYAPLIYGVGGIDVRSEPLANQRTHSQARHAAASAHLRGDNAVSSVPFHSITGTSAAAVVVSSAAAVVWSHAPTENAHRIMRLLRESATETVLDTAEYCFDDGASECGPAHIIRVCEALAYACDEGTASCPSSYATTTCADLPEPLAPPEYVLSDTEAPVTFATVTSDTCSDGSEIIFDEENTDSNCPSAEYYGALALPLTLPMPHDPECPWCLAYAGDEVEGARLELFTVDDFSVLENPTIAVIRPGDITRYPLGPGLTGTENIVILPDPLGEGVEAVVLEYTRAGEPVFHFEPLHITW